MRCRAGSDDACSPAHITHRIELINEGDGGLRLSWLEGALLSIPKAPASNLLHHRPLPQCLKLGNPTWQSTDCRNGLRNDASISSS